MAVLISVSARAAAVAVAGVLGAGTVQAQGWEPTKTVEFIVPAGSAETPEWKEFMERGAFNQTALTGEAYRNWVAKEEQRHRELMKEAGFIAN